MSSEHKKAKRPTPEEIEIKGTLVNNLNCQTLGKQGTFGQHTCLPTELIKNGGFEAAGIFGEYADWDESLDNIETKCLNFPYEGVQSAELKSIGTVAPKTKTAVLAQSVTVPPGCFLLLSFADCFMRAGKGFEFLRIRASVFYDTTNLINVEIIYNSFQAEQCFIYHQRVSDNPVPSNVSSVTVQFLVEMKDKEDTSWLLDGVSLRVV
ncbi:MAG: hypothetical protein ACOX3A_08580 [bacterium]|jgi:hypothetical protein